MPLNELFVEVTNHCSQYCVHCSSCGSVNNYAEINLSHLRKLIDDSIPLGLKTFTISGGEPFLYSDLFNLVEYLNLKDIPTTIYSCGVIANEKRYASIPFDIFSNIKSKGVHKIIFSLHGGSQNTQAQISGIKDSYTLLVESLQNAQKAGLDVELHTVPMVKNFNELEKIIQLASNLNVKQVSFLRLVQQGRAIDSLLLSKNEMQNFGRNCAAWEEKYKNVKIRLGTPMNCITFAGKTCRAGIDKLLISATGEYFPCEAFKYLKGKRPTIYDTSIKDVWENDKLLNRIRNITIEQIGYCAKCPVNDKCRGGCAGQRMLSNGDLLKGPDPCCVHF